MLSYWSSWFNESQTKNPVGVEQLLSFIICTVDKAEYFPGNTANRKTRWLYIMKNIIDVNKIRSILMQKKISKHEKTDTYFSMSIQVQIHGQNILKILIPAFKYVLYIYFSISFVPHTIELTPEYFVMSDLFFFNISACISQQ